MNLLRCRARGIEAVQADTTMTFARHTHDHFGLGRIERGAQKSASGRGPVEATAGDLITVNPGEVHDGAPIGERGRSWRMLYLEPAVVAELVFDVTEGRAARDFEFTQPVFGDRHMARLFDELFVAMTSLDGEARQGLKADEMMVLTMGRLLRPAATLRSMPAAMASARALMDDDPSAALTLGRLAQEAGLSRYQFVRRFARATGLTPHAYLMQRRLQRARQLILGGQRPVEAAMACGFADQSHMTRLFVRSFGMPPGAYARARG